MSPLDQPPASRPTTSPDSLHAVRASRHDLVGRPADRGPCFPVLCDDVAESEASRLTQPLTSKSTMHPVRLAALFLAGTGIAVSLSAGIPGDETFDAAQLLKGAKSYYLEVEQTYTSAPDTTLPFADTVNALMKSSGLTVASYDDADVRVRVHAEGRPLSRRYNDLRRAQAVEHFSGAEIKGWCEFARQDGRYQRAEFLSRREPPLNIHQAYEDPSLAPYAGSFTGFVQFFCKTVSLAYGSAPMSAILRCPDSEDYFYTVPQLQVCAATELAYIGGDQAKAVLLQALQSFSPHRQAGAARGLRLLGANDALPALIGALNTLDGLVPEDFAHDNRWQVMTHIDRALQPDENDAGYLEPMPEILSAIASLSAPDKVGPLLAVLRNPDLPLARTGAALLLGREHNPTAYKSLLSVAQGDAHPLVRLAAINALGELHDQRAVTDLKALTQTAKLAPEKMAIRHALENCTADATTVAGNTDK